MESLRNSFGFTIQSFSRGDIHAIQIVVPDPEGKKSTYYRTLIHGDSSLPLQVFSSCQEEILKGPLFKKYLESKDSKIIDEAIYGSIELACYTIKAYGLNFIPRNEVEEDKVLEMLGEFDRTSPVGNMNLMKLYLRPKNLRFCWDCRSLFVRIHVLDELDGGKWIYAFCNTCLGNRKAYGYRDPSIEEMDFFNTQIMLNE